MQEVELDKPQSMMLKKWRPPEKDIHKANFDAAVFKASNLVGIGVVVRDWRGKAVRALLLPISLSNSVVDMEAVED